MSTTESPASPLAVSAAAEFDGVSVGSGVIDLAVVVDLSCSGAAVGGPRPSLAVSFVLDASGSMGGAPIVQVKDSVARLVDLLAPSDSVAVIAFADNATVVAEKAPLSAAHKASVKRRLAGVAASGGTGMSNGVRAGAAALGARGENERQVLVLLTDGAPTDGSNKTNLGALVESLRPDVSTTTLGYGVNHQADLLAAVAKSGGGQYWYIPDPKDAQVEFARALGAQGDVVVDGVELVLRPEDGVEVIEVVGATKTRLTSSGMAVPQPDLRAEQQHTTILKLRLDVGREARRVKLLTLQVRFRRAGKSAVETIDIPVGVDVVHGANRPNLAAARKVALAHAEQRRAEARAEADQGRFDGAAVILRAVVKVLEALPGYQKLDGSAVSEAVEQLIDEIQAYETKPSAQQYLEFRSTNLAVDLAQGAVHAADVKAQSSISRALMIGVVGGGEAIGDLVIAEAGGAEQRVPMAGELTLGRVQGNDIVIPRGNISKRHTRFVVRDGKAIVVDLKSTNGTVVNGQRMSTPQVLSEGDRVIVGDFTIRFEPKKP